MAVRSVASRLGFVLVVALLVGAALSLPALSNPASSVGQQLTVESHQPESILATTAEESGDLSLSGTADSKHVVIDTGHGNDVDRATLAPMIDALTRNGHSVTFYRGERNQPLNASLRTADAFVVVEPGQSFTTAERRGMGAFTEAGGRVLLAGEPPSQGLSLASLLGLPAQQGGATAPMTGLAASFGFGIGDGYVYDLDQYDTNYRNPYASPTAGIGGDAKLVTLHEATTVTGGTQLLETSETSTVSSDRMDGARTVAARDDNVVVLGDASLLDREWIRRNDNEAFVSGVLEFLVIGDKEAGIPAPPGGDGGQSPTSPGPGQSPAVSSVGQSSSS
jgi:hypothetical protein